MLVRFRLQPVLPVYIPFSVFLCFMIKNSKTSQIEYLNGNIWSINLNDRLLLFFLLLQITQT